MDSKKPYLSKTIILNTIVTLAGVLAGLGLFPSLAVFLKAHGDIVISALGALGVGLRYITHGKISLSD